MKKILVLSALIILSLSSCKNSSGKEENSTENNLKQNIELSGTLVNSSGETLQLFYSPSSGQQLIDSAKLDEKGNFTFQNLHIPHTGFYTLKISDQLFCPMILDSNQKITVSGDAKNLGNNHTISGSDENNLFKEINSKIIKYKRSIDSLGSDFQAKMGPNNMNKTGFEDLSKKYEGIYNTFTEKFYIEMKDVMKQNPNSFASVAAAVQLDPTKFSEECSQLHESLSKKYPGNPTLNSYYNYIKKYSLLSKGSLAPEINLQNPNSKSISLSSLKGKYVLIDFWASWCKPCIKDMPDVKKLYSKYKGKGFEILGVSLDENKDAWIDAISEYELPWLHVSDLGGWNSSAAKTYEVNSIPFTVLIDPDGKIIEKGLRGTALDEKLNEIFTKK
ncbi:MAG: thioredoxin-like domain-containing protein [Bacteroidota bacterium]|jgi:peroxiredoxin